MSTKINTLILPSSNSCLQATDAESFFIVLVTDALDLDGKLLVLKQVVKDLNLGKKQSPSLIKQVISDFHTLRSNPSELKPQQTIESQKSKKFV